MANRKVTGRKAASRASKTLRSSNTSSKSKSAAGSALSQRKAPAKQTSSKAASNASKTLRDGRTSRASKSAAGSALAQKIRSKEEIMAVIEEGDLRGAFKGFRNRDTIFEFMYGNKWKQNQYKYNYFYA